MTSLQELEAIRRRWDQRHRELGLPDPSGHTPASPDGLGRRVQDLSTRIVILPADPRATRVEFDEELWAWWEESTQSTPFGARCVWTDNVATLSAAVRARSRGDVLWHTFLALHRHGGVEIGTGDTYPLQGHRCFRLIRTVGLLWMAIETERDVLRHVDAKGPWQVTLALYDTEDGYLGELAEGWQQPGHGRRVPLCVEPNVVIQEEVDDWPDDPERLREMAFRVGARIEDAWGFRNRRFLANRGDLEGEFDARSWRL